MMWTATEAARLLGGEVSGNRISCPGPGHSKDDRSLRVWFDDSGRLKVHSFANDEWRTCADHVRHVLGMPAFEQASSADRPAPSEPSYKLVENRRIEAASAAQKARLAARIWAEAVPCEGTLAETYLAGRDLYLPANTERVLRFHPATPRQTERQPALIARFTPICRDDDAPVSAILRIFLKPDGSGHDGKMCLGSPWTDEAKPRLLFQAIKLSPDCEVEQGLHLTEGIETGLALLMFRLAPVWATFAAPGLATFPILHGISCLNVMADHDESGAGLKAAMEVARRYQAAGTQARVILAEKVGTDWADRWQEFRSEQLSERRAR